MSKTARLSRDIDTIELGFVEREATPKFAMKLGIPFALNMLIRMLPELES